MNTDRLAKHYDKLTPWERLPLLIAAGARGDEAEQDRLARSAPMTSYCVSDCFCLADGLEALANYHMKMQLELAACFWIVWGVSRSTPTNKTKHKPHDDRAWPPLAMAAHRFVFQADVWQHFCCDLGIDPAALLRLSPGYDLIVRTEEVARLAACTEAEANAWHRKRWEAAEEAAGRPAAADREFRMQAAADAAKGLRETLEHLEKRLT